jgi:uncharacterized protein (TIGR00251 family)
MTWFKIEKQQVKITILAKPNAKKTALVGLNEQGLQISLHAMPQEGEANKELIAYLSKLLKVPKSQIILQRGEGSRHKQVLLPLTDKVQELLDEPNRFILTK